MSSKGFGQIKYRNKRGFRFHLPLLSMALLYLKSVSYLFLMSVHFTLKRYNALKASLNFHLLEVSGLVMYSSAGAVFCVPVEELIM